MIDARLDDSFRLSDVARELKMGDVAVVNYTGACDGKPITEIAPTVLNRRLCGFTPQEFATLCGLLHKLLDE